MFLLCTFCRLRALADVFDNIKSSPQQLRKTVGPNKAQSRRIRLMQR